MTFRSSQAVFRSYMSIGNSTCLSSTGAAFLSTSPRASATP